MKARCPFCHLEMEIPRKAGEKGYCRCGAYSEIDLLSHAHLFFQRAKKALGVGAAASGPGVEVVDGGIVFETEREPAIIQWAKKPQGIS